MPGPYKTHEVTGFSKRELKRWDRNLKHLEADLRKEIPFGRHWTRKEIQAQWPEGYPMDQCR